MLKHRGGLSTMYLCKYFTINLMNKFQGILSFNCSTVWKVLFGKVYSIHEAAENNLKRFAEEFGPEWAMQHLVPQVLDMVTNPHYLHRMMVLRAISLMATSSKRQVQCGKTSAIAHPHSRPVMDLREDPDVDVRYFANQPLRSIDSAAVAQSSFQMC
ncbi:hypothetical protein HID58_048576 [Brassica napus]|uniref:Uncharacterized protein n=1 Tax=Brassica napus TaxID=3708 RepID=A0ABQ8B2U2_BRANA|nr:hypothetical protein HID58_048576 [Brassica napus]